jgi:hypothetical protein
MRGAPFRFAMAINKTFTNPHGSYPECLVQE